jgi:hypothetical protein
MLFDAKLRGIARLVGIITAGGGLNLAHWITEAQEQGYTVERIPGGALLYLIGKQSPR